MRIVLLLLLVFGLTSSNICDQYTGHIESVYDGDTVTCDVELGFNVNLNDVKLRLYGIDAPEIRGVERPQGIVSRDALRQLINGKDITFIDHGKGKYGRIIAEIFLDTINVSDWMVRNGYAEYADY